MNIGIVTQWFASGAGYVSRSYTEVLAKTHRVYIYARGGPALHKDPTWNGQEVTWAPKHPVLTGIHERHFKKWIRENRISVVIFNEQRHWAGIVLAKKIGLLVGGYVDYYRQDTVPLFGIYDFLICNTKRHYEVFKGHSQCVYCPWGTQTDRFRPRNVRQKRPLTFIISGGWCGSSTASSPYMDRRGVGITMRVFNRLKELCRLIVYSQIPLKECPVEWRNLVLNDGRIEFRGGTFDPFPYFEGDIYVYPSRLDGIGLTLPEALSSGLPSITTECAPMNEFVRHGENGLLIKVKEFLARPDGYYWPESICDEESLKDAMLQYIHDPKMMQDHSINAREYAEKELDWGKNAYFLADWIEKQKRQDKINNDLERLAKKSDLYINPTPVQRILIGGNALFKSITN